MKQNLIKQKSFNLALEIINLEKNLQDQKEYVISKQLLRSGTSIGANVQEADASPTRKDFAYKMSIASKEARETKYWLTLLHQSNLTTIPVDNYLPEINSIINILTKIVKTTSINPNPKSKINEF